MSLITVVKDVCAAVGVAMPTSVFSGINSNRTMAEMLALANEMAQRIAYDTREWTVLVTGIFLVGDGITEAFSLPANFKRLLLTSELWRSTSSLYPMRFIADQNMWTQRRLWGYADQRGEWIIFGGQIHIQPIMTGPPPPSPAPANWVGGTLYPIDALARDTDGYTIWKCLISHTPPVSGETFTQNRTVNPTFWTQAVDPNPLPWAYTTWYSIGARARDTANNTVWACLIRHLTPASGTFAANRVTNPGFWAAVPPPPAAIRAALVYLDKNCINLASGGVGDAFQNDGDSFRLDERILKLGMIWQWKALKGSPYAEDMSSYEDALARVAGADKPAPIMVGRVPISAAVGASYPFPIDPGMVPL
jgi:hypothetical protein